MSELFLFQSLNNLREHGFASELPDYIEENLSNNVQLRAYQMDAFKNLITYFENEKIKKNKQPHLLFHMATGSGKTVMMAGLILYLYNKGYRKFLFFVNQTNILEKTKENFLNHKSNKYLFDNKIEINKSEVSVREVDNFSVVNNADINISFTTTQKLHTDLFAPKENSLTIEDFEDDKIVLISDESHHVNSWTKEPNKSEEEEIKSWEYSVKKIFNANKDNILLEFTATCDLKDPNVNQKYKDKIVFDYPLAKFRSSGYTKDFQNKQSDYKVWERTLIALVLSEYRKNLFSDIGQNIKPVVLLKSQRIEDSKNFYVQFFELLDKLTTAELIKLDTSNDRLLHLAIEYFKNKDETLNALVQSLKFSFAKEKAIIMNGSTDNTIEKQLAVNSLEDKDNHYRIIFTVDMLNEGWDVLNLFDIVRLYETRQGSGKPGKIGQYTIKEAQLIGRGARYCPFIETEDQDRYKRKYDYDIKNEKRILETLLYHSFDNSRYINELRQALKETGLLPEKPIEIQYRLKNSFKTEKIYKEGFVFANKKIEISRNSVLGVDNKIRNLIVTKRITSGTGKLYSLFDDSVDKYKEDNRFIIRIKVKDISYNILHSAILNFEALKFNALKSYFPNLKSLKEFLYSSDYIGNITLQIESSRSLNPIDYYDSVLKALEIVSNHVKNIKTEYQGT
ncbi:MAG: DEAD/DEAH box helicase family protein, partial [Halanaerobiales bacterium]